MVRLVIYSLVSTLIFGYAGASSEKESVMLVERLNPGRLHAPVGQSLIVVSNAKRVAYFAANSLDENNNVVGIGDFEKQLLQANKNLEIALDELGADHTNIVKMVAYIVNYDASYHGPIMAKLLAQRPQDFKYPATMLLSVAGLALPQNLVELDVVIALE